MHLYLITLISILAFMCLIWLIKEPVGALLFIWLTKRHKQGWESFDWRSRTIILPFLRLFGWLYRSNAAKKASTEMRTSLPAILSIHWPFSERDNSEERFGKNCWEFYLSRCVEMGGKQLKAKLVPYSQMIEKLDMQLEDEPSIFRPFTKQSRDAMKASSEIEPFQVQLSCYCDGKWKLIGGPLTPGGADFVRMGKYLCWKDENSKAPRGPVQATSPLGSKYSITVMFHVENYEEFIAEITQL